MDTLEAKKTWLAGEVGGLRTVQAELEEIQKNVDSLKREVDGAKATKQLATERAVKANETADNLHKEVDVERESCAALKAQVGMLTKHLEDTKAIGLATTELYVGALEQFRGLYVVASF